MSVASLGLTSGQSKGSYTSANIVVSRGGQVIEASNGTGASTIPTDLLTSITTLQTESAALLQELNNIDLTTLQTNESTLETNSSTLITKYESLLDYYNQVVSQLVSITKIPPTTIFELGYNDIAVKTFIPVAEIPTEVFQSDNKYAIWNGSLEEGNYILYANLTLQGDAAAQVSANGQYGEMWDYNIGYCGLVNDGTSNPISGVNIISSSFTQYYYTSNNDNAGVILPLTGSCGFNVSSTEANQPLTLYILFARQITNNAEYTLEMKNTIQIQQQTESYFTFSINTTCFKLVKF